MASDFGSGVHLSQALATVFVSCTLKGGLCTYQVLLDVYIGGKKYGLGNPNIDGL